MKEQAETLPKALPCPKCYGGKPCGGLIKQVSEFVYKCDKCRAKVVIVLGK